jgi:hypothetical protein
MTSIARELAFTGGINSPLERFVGFLIYNAHKAIRWFLATTLFPEQIPAMLE